MGVGYHRSWGVSKFRSRKIPKSDQPQCSVWCVQAWRSFVITMDGKGVNPIGMGERKRRVMRMDRGIVAGGGRPEWNWGCRH